MVTSAVWKYWWQDKDIVTSAHGQLFLLIPQYGTNEEELEGEDAMNRYGHSCCSKELMTAASSYQTSMRLVLKCDDTWYIPVWSLLLFKRAHASCFFLPNIDEAGSEVWRHFRYFEYGQSSCSKELMTAASAYQTSMRRKLKHGDTSCILNMARAAVQKSSWQLLLLTKHRWGRIWSVKTLSVYWIWLFKRAHDSCFFLPNIDDAESEAKSEVWRHFRYIKYDQSSCSKELLVMTAAFSYQTSMGRDVKCEDTFDIMNMTKAAVQKSSYQLLPLTKHRLGGIWSVKILPV
jgi:isoprenylcysteine carboxyl methyltransferase (ICMT) family protein YpbQ